MPLVTAPERVERCQERCEVNILGNWNDFLPDPARAYDNEALAWWPAQVGPDKGSWQFLGMFENTDLAGDGPVPTVVGYGDTHDAFYEVDHARRTLFNTGSVGNSMGDPTPVYVVLEGVVGGLDESPFSISFVRVPYDVEAEVAAARDLGMPELDHYAVEIRHGIYRGDVRAGTPPRYHRAPARAGSGLETRV
jgi:hypothetical protein